LRNSNSDANAISYANAYTYTDSNAHSYTDSNAYTHPNSYSNAYTYPDAWRDHAQCAWAQGAGQAYGGSLLDRGNLGQHRHLP
jgi:hypothetical protein